MAESNTARPGESHVAVTPSDTADIARTAAGYYPRALYFGTGGTAVVVTPDGVALSYTNLPNGYLLPVNAKRVNSTGLSGAAGIIGIY